MDEMIQLRPWTKCAQYVHPPTAIDVEESRRIRPFPWQPPAQRLACSCPLQRVAAPSALGSSGGGHACFEAAIVGLPSGHRRAALESKSCRRSEDLDTSEDV